jgi:SAM-dependent methyltransferase
MSHFQPLPGVITEISARDAMYEGNTTDSDPALEAEWLGHYFWLGHSAIQWIRHALRAAQRPPTEIRSILDLPCGHGRVMRSLKASFPDAALTACDIDRDAVEFCGRIFGATPVYGAVNPAELEFGQRFDVIWCGSLLTHLDPVTHWSGFLGLFERSLGDAAVLVFTTLGRAAAESMRSGSFDHGLDEQQIASILDQFHDRGAGYVDFTGHRDYGISIAAPSQVAGLVERETTLRLVGYTEAGWGSHQDVVACVRSNP